jgi:hypothetical protein
VSGQRLGVRHARWVLLVIPFVLIALAMHSLVPRVGDAIARAIAAIAHAPDGGTSHELK